MSGNRIPKRKLSTLIASIAGSAIAVAAIASGAATGATTVAAATAQTKAAAPAQMTSTRFNPAGSVALAAFTKPLTTVKPAAPSSYGTPREIAQSMLASYGWTSGQFMYLNSLWMRESGWDPRAANASSGAYGIPQAMPGGKMASAGPDWPSSAATQIRWGLRYIKNTYGSPLGAWDHEAAYGWY